MDGGSDASALTTGRAAVPARPSVWTGFRWLWLASILVPAAGFAGVAWTVSGAIEAEARNRVRHNVDLLHEHALHAFETQEALLAAIQGQIRYLDWDTIRDSSELRRFLVELDQRTPSTAGIVLVDPEGRLAMSSLGDFPSPPSDLLDRDYVRAHRGLASDAPVATFVGEVLRSRPSGRVVFTLSRPRQDANGQNDGGTLASTFPAAAFARFYAAASENVGDAVTLARADGAILARTPERADPVGLRAPPGSPVMAAFAAAADGRGEVRARAAFDGVERIIAFRRVGEYPVLIAYGLDVAVLRQAWLRQLLAPGLGALAAAALLLGLTARSQRMARRANAEAERRADAEAARAAAEAKLRHSERVGALGRLAAGVAHDFGNALQSIASGARLVGNHADEPDRVRRYATLIAEAADRGTKLTARMRNFARRPAPCAAAPARMETASVIGDACALLASSLKSEHRLRCDVAPDLPIPRGIERTDLEAAIVNLVLNARDAMPEGGEIVVAAVSRQLSAAAASELGATASGGFLELRVMDSGIGMDAATLARAGEAFFTTKGPDQGTGLGLPMVRGVAERAGGALALESEPGVGTVVTLWLPTDAAVHR